MNAVVDQPERTSIAPEADSVTVDERNPWLGLASFTEETRGYFYGREEEVAELGRRVQRKLLTVLFGKSGLGKTSVLRAGLVPRLRGQNYCPIYVRIDYAQGTPEPAEQIKQAIRVSARRAGEWTQVGVAAEGESLWEFLHHRDDVLRDESGKALTPLLIFDQFEEIFTLAQSDDFGRARAARFIAELADLVENRPPAALDASMESDEAVAERFDFARADYRVLIALREDYLAQLESLKKSMPSISQNRLRLAPMTGSQALQAVVQPGGRLVTEEVAAAIVRFVAGGSELANAEVEPSLLSLICRELNDARLAQGRSEISLDLLAGSHASILTNFYERSLADQAPEVRRIIEDDLLTSSGFRESVAEERLLSLLAGVGAGPETLATLVNRRLLRIEERLDVRRVELTHDVLCSVVKGSRDRRHEREAREATERMLLEQRERELAARRSMTRARQVAAVCAVLALGALLAAVLAFRSTQRAHRAERVAVASRVQAEQLLGYLTDDFARELENSGRLDVVADLAKREVDYLHALPPELKGPDTERNGALALMQYAKAERALARPKEAAAASREGLELLEGLRRGGDRSSATTIALARANMIAARVLQSSQDPATLSTARRAVELIAPIAQAPGASLAARRAQVEILGYLGALQTQAFVMPEDAVKTLTQTEQLAAALGGKDVSQLEMAAQYAEAGAWLMQSEATAGHFTEARAVGEDAAGVAEKLLEARPNHRMALHALEIIRSGLAGLALNDLRPLDALALSDKDVAIALSQLQLDPKNIVSQNNLGVARGTQCDAAWTAGRLREAVQFYRQGFAESLGIVKAGANFVLTYVPAMSQLAFKQADMGDEAAAAATLEDAERLVTGLRETEPAASHVPLYGECQVSWGKAQVQLARGNLGGARRWITLTAPIVAGIKSAEGLDTASWNFCVYYSVELQGQVEYLMGDAAASERTLRQAQALRKRWPVSFEADHRDEAIVSTYLALALDAQGRNNEARQVLAPVLTYQRDLAARNHGDQLLWFEMALALYAEALSDPPQRAALLQRAVARLDAMPAQMQALRTVQLWRGKIREAQHTPVAAVRANSPPQHG